jgi:hypothetical protein
MSAEDNGKRFAEQLLEADVQIGWPTAWSLSVLMSLPQFLRWVLPPAQRYHSAAFSRVNIEKYCFIIRTAFLLLLFPWDPSQKNGVRQHSGQSTSVFR